MPNGNEVVSNQPRRLSLELRAFIELLQRSSAETTVFNDYVKFQGELDFDTLEEFFKKYL